MSSRLPASERKAALLDTACGIFACGSYRGTTTAEIAREAGVTEPILYRHFDSKRALYLACLDQAWGRVQALWEDAIAGEPHPSRWLHAMGFAYLSAKDKGIRLVDLWIQALTEASADPEIRRALRRQIRAVHDFVRDVIVRAQEAGAMVADRDAEAEAWIFLSIGLLGTIDRRLKLLEGDFDRIVSSRREWMTGHKPV